MRYRDLGTVVLERDGVELPVGGPKPAVLLAMLLIHRNRRVSAGALMDALWGADAGKRNKATLESHVWRLRKGLEPGRRHGESPRGPGTAGAGGGGSGTRRRGGRASGACARSWSRGAVTPRARRSWSTRPADTG